MKRYTTLSIVILVICSAFLFSYIRKQKPLPFAINEYLTIPFTNQYYIWSETIITSDLDDRSYTGSLEDPWQVLLKYSTDGTNFHLFPEKRYETFSNTGSTRYLTATSGVLFISATTTNKVDIGKTITFQFAKKIR